MSAVHAAMTALALTYAELDKPDEADVKLERVRRGFDHLVLTLAQVGLECIESHDQPRCGNCGRAIGATVGETP